MIPAYNLGIRATYNMVLKQMLGVPVANVNRGSIGISYGARVSESFFDIPIHSGNGFFLIHVAISEFNYGKIVYGGIHEFAEYCMELYDVIR